MMVSPMYTPPSAPSYHHAAYRPGPLEPRFELSRSMDFSMPVSSISTSRLPRPFLSETSPKRARTTATPPTEETQSTRPSLPSISTLLNIADDADRSRHESDQRHASQRMSSREHNSGAAYPALEVPGKHRAIHSPAMSHRSDTSMDYSPSSATAPSSSPRRTALSISALSVDSSHQRASSASSDRYATGPSSATPYSASSGPASPYQYSPSTTSVSSAHSPAEPSSAPFYGQPSSSTSQQHPPSLSPSSSWPHQHHHHYINSSSQSSLSQSQERYVCSKCQKAFSRPSSLKIHSHSHTGEKPFVCPYSGCGKSFSVRSNMRRHERGCHSPSNKMGGDHADLL